MTELSNSFRKGLRKFFIFLGVAAISLVFQACYGMPPDDLEDERDSFNTEGKYSENKTPGNNE
ncbi:MAG: hypothetical protein FWB73_05870 [Treponema sp.]|nr:hypothetical protein [Treponema sp.]